MSLNGNLEDLPLLDILQIVSFSKKTGYLSIRTDAGEGAIVFKDGYVVAAFSAETPPFDKRYRLLPPAKLAMRCCATASSAASSSSSGFGRGSSASASPKRFPLVIGARDITEETLPEGINAQELLLDLARGMDEDRRDSTAALEASFAEAPPGAMPRGRGGDARSRGSRGPRRCRRGPSRRDEGPGTVLLVDDEDEVRRILAERFAGAGYNVVEAEDPDAAVKKAGRLAKASIPFLLVTDLGMPTSGGTSFQGGFEVVKRLWKMNLRPPVLLMAETLNSTLQARARQMEISHFVFKPGLSKLDPEQFEADLRAFATKIAADLLPRLAAAGPGAAAPAPGGRRRRARRAARGRRRPARLRPAARRAWPARPRRRLRPRPRTRCRATSSSSRAGSRSCAGARTPPRSRPS